MSTYRESFWGLLNILSRKEKKKFCTRKYKKQTTEREYLLATPIYTQREDCYNT